MGGGRGQEVPARLVHASKALSPIRPRGDRQPLADLEPHAPRRVAEEKLLLVHLDLVRAEPNARRRDREPEDPAQRPEPGRRAFRFRRRLESCHIRLRPDVALTWAEDRTAIRGDPRLFVGVGPMAPAGKLNSIDAFTGFAVAIAEQFAQHWIISSADPMD